jgi:hypothetical protein
VRGRGFLFAFAVVAVGVGLFCGPASASSAPGGYWRHCGDTIVAHNLHCKKAHRIGLGYIRGMERFIESPSPKGFSCHSQRVAKITWHVACRRERGHVIQQVRFFYTWG